MSKKPSQKPKSQRETSPSVLKPALIRRFDRRITGQGEMELPCAPSMLEPYTTKCASIFSALGKPFSNEEVDRLRDALKTELARGHAASPYSRLHVRWETHRPPHPGIQYFVTARIQTLEEMYAVWGEGQTTPLFGRLPDAKVTSVASELGDPRSVPVLDIGAGNGRNSIPLARLGHPTHAIEPVERMATEIRTAAEMEKLPLKVTMGSVLRDDFQLPKGEYKLAIVAEVTSHFQRVEDMRRLFERLADALAPGGMAVVTIFLTADGYKPDEMAREVAVALWSTMFTRAELNFITQDLPFDKVSDESMLEYEKERVPADAWPPTQWYEAWVAGSDVFALPMGKAPIENRWVTFRRR